MKTIKILLVDDHSIVRQGLKHVLGLQSKFISDIDEAADGNEAVQMASVFNYDIIIMDVQMPNKDGIQATKDILKKKPATKVLTLSMFNELNYIKSMINAGAKGYVLKVSGPEELSNAILTVLEGGKFFSNDVALKLMDEQHPKKTKTKEKLTSLQIEIIKLISSEHTSEQIAQQLHISKRTVDGHRERIMNKLGVNTTAAIIKYAVENKLA